MPLEKISKETKTEIMKCPHCDKIIRPFKEGEFPYCDYCHNFIDEIQLKMYNKKWDSDVKKD